MITRLHDIRTDNTKTIIIRQTCISYRAVTADNADLRTGGLFPQTVSFAFIENNSFNGKILPGRNNIFIKILSARKSDGAPFLALQQGPGSCCCSVPERWPAMSEGKWPNGQLHQSHAIQNGIRPALTALQAGAGTTLYYINMADNTGAADQFNMREPGSPCH